MIIVPYDEQYKKDFVELNKEWITEMFVLEEEDVRLLSSIDQEVARGAQIFFAIDEDTNKVASCCMVAPCEAQTWEIEKFATRKEYERRGAGTACLLACIEYAREQGAKRLVIVSNTKCWQALRLYRKYGFTEIPIDREVFPFERGNISFELKLEDASL